MKPDSSGADVCGIAGYVQAISSRGEWLAAMLAAVAHRGPDGEGQWRAERQDVRVALGHRRLSILDLETGAQPMATEDRALTITFNGEIHNFRELRAGLEARGFRFRTRSDTEVVLQLYAEGGVSGLRALNGMFAFALWDDRKHQLVLARDRVGIKPLFYAALDDGGVAFASELTTLLSCSAVSRKPSVDGLVSYFFSDYVHPPFTIVEGARKLLPGHAVIWKDGRLGEPLPFTHLPDVTGALHDPEELARELWTRLDTAVERQLYADVPVGMFLSGGLDSSVIARLATRRSKTPMKAFSIGFSERSFDEIRYARLVARTLGAEHIERTLDEGSMLEILGPALDKLDEPLADPSYLPTFLLSKLASEHVKLVLSGDGGDELWAGYPTHLAHRMAQAYALFPERLKGALAATTRLLAQKDHYQSWQWKLARFAGRWADDPIERHLRWMSSVDLPHLSRAVRGAAGIMPPTLGAPPSRDSDALATILKLDFTTYLPGSVLTKVDRAAMAHGLEVRPPFLDDEIVDFAFRLPSTAKLKGLTQKYLLKKAARGHVPEEIIARQKKGFGIPLARWIRGPLAPHVSRIFAESPAWEVLNRATFVSWQHDHAARRADHSKPLWALLVLDHWMRRIARA